MLQRWRRPRQVRASKAKSGGLFFEMELGGQASSKGSSHSAIPFVCLIPRKCSAHPGDL
jgi:hypothetical protein